MSQENVEIVRQLLDAYNRADFDAVTERCDEDFEFTSVMSAVEETSYRGKDTWERYWHDMHQTWDDWRLEDLRVLDGGDDRVAALMRLVGTGKTSGVPVDREIGIAYRMRDGMMWRARSYLDPREALAASGLSEQVMSQEKVETVRSAIDAFNRRDLDALSDFCDEDFEFVSVLTAIDAEDATYRGANGWADYFAVMDEMWEGWRVEDVRVFDAGEDRAACLFRLVGQGRLSGVPVEREVGITYRFRGRKMWRIRSYPDPAEALEAVGLSE